MIFVGLVVNNYHNKIRSFLRCVQMCPHTHTHVCVCVCVWRSRMYSCTPTLENEFYTIKLRNGTYKSAGGEETSENVD